MLIVEGSDCVGKSTLVNALCTELEYRNFPAIPQHFGLLPKNWNYVIDYLPYINEHTVMDRFILSEVVYGTVLRNGPHITPWQYKFLDGQLRLNGSVTVALFMNTHSYSTWLEKEYARRKQAFNINDLVKVNEAFFDVADLYKSVMFKEYEVDIDFAFNCSINWPDKNFVDSVVSEYLRRQDACKQIV